MKDMYVETVSPMFVQSPAPCTSHTRLAKEELLNFKCHAYPLGDIMLFASEILPLKYSYSNFPGTWYNFAGGTQ